MTARWIHLAIVAGLAPQAGFADSGSDVVLPPVYIFADPLGERTADDLVQPVSVLTGEALEKRRAGTLGEVLDGLPGVANSHFGPGVGRPVVRGLQGARVKVLEDGLSVADVSGEGADHAIAVDMGRATQVEVFRGPSTLLYGSGAAGGVVNVVSNRFSPGVPATTQATGALSYGYNGDDRNLFVGLDQPIADQFALRGDFSSRRTSDFRIDGFQQEGQTAGNRNRLRNSSVQTDSAQLTGLWRQDDFNLAVGLSFWETEYGIPANFDARPRAEGGQSDDFERVFADYWRFDLRGEMQRPVEGFSLARLKLAYTEFEQEEVEFEFNRTSAGGELDERIVEADFANDEFDARFEMVHDPIAGWRGVLGLQLTDRDFFADDPRGGERTFYVRPNQTRSLAAFAVEELPTDFGRIELAARIERERSRADDVFGSRVAGYTSAQGDFVALPEQLERRRYTPLSLSAGSIVDVGTDHHLRLSLTRAERAPSAEQLYAFGRHAAAGSFEVGNPDLSKERYINLELGFDRHVGDIRYDATFFANRVEDFIFLASEADAAGSPVFVNDIGNRAGEGAAAGCESGDGGLCRLRNRLLVAEQDNARFYGAEFGMSMNLTEAPLPMTFRLSGDHVRGKLGGDRGDLPRITPTRIGAGVDTSIDRVDISFDARRVFRQSRVAEAEVETSGFNLLSFDVVWRPQQWQGSRVFLQGRNLLNENGRLHQSFFRDDAPIVGRQIIAGLRVDFSG